MIYAIQINGGPGFPAARSGFQFIKAALAEGHAVLRVFFYHEGVHQGFVPGGAGPDGLVPDWAALAEAHGLDLVLCVSAAERRGRAAGDVAPGFRVGGLGQWMEACLKADRVMVFG